MEKETERLSLDIDADLHRSVKIRAAEVRKTMTELVEAALRLYLEGKHSEGK